MKTTSIHIAGALILTVCLGVSCRKELPAQAEGGEPVTVRATISDAPDTRVTYTENEAGTQLKSAWAVGDRIVGWDDAGNKLELEIANADRITTDGTAIFTTVTGSASLPTSGKIYMIYAPGKHYGDVGDKTLMVDLRSQAEGVIPALMMATGIVDDRQIKLHFSNEMSIVMVKNPKFVEAPNTLIGGLVLSGDNVYTSVNFHLKDDGTLEMTPSDPGSITKTGIFSTGSDGTPASDVTFYFAVPPCAAQKEISVNSFLLDGYGYYIQNGSFVKNKCYKIQGPEFSRFKYKITAKSYPGGTFTTDPADRTTWGTEVAVTPAPASVHWVFDPGSLKVTLDDSGAGLALLDGKFSMPKSDVTVDGTFQKVKYTLTSSVNDDTMGSVTMQYTTDGTPITSGTDIEWDTNVTVTPHPNEGYVVDTVKYNDGSSDYDVTLDTTTSAYKFNMPTHNATVTVTFKIQVPGTTPDYPITEW